MNSGTREDSSLEVQTRYFFYCVGNGNYAEASRVFRRNPEILTYARDTDLPIRESMLDHVTSFESNRRPDTLLNVSFGEH